ncbi:MAG: type II toxin-antitoxin system VapC family toxin [Actinomycetota bacterium]
MTTFVDTSAIYALLANNDLNHEPARSWFESARSEKEPLISHNYVVVESAALVRRRMGDEVVSALFERLLVPIRVIFVDEPLHRAAVSTHLARPTRPSLVDQVSFHFMRDLALRRAFAFDADFVRNGFETVP